MTHCSNLFHFRLNPYAPYCPSKNASPVACNSLYDAVVTTLFPGTNLYTTGQSIRKYVQIRILDTDRHMWVQSFSWKNSHQSFTSLGIVKLTALDGSSVQENRWQLQSVLLENRSAIQPPPHSELDKPIQATQPCSSPLVFVFPN